MEEIFHDKYFAEVTIYPYEVKKDDSDKLDSVDIKPCMSEGCWYGWY